jgi:serine/threonine protein kinase
MPSTVVGPGHVIAGRYRIERWLGQGGMGSVYRALQLSVQRTVALKRLVDEHLESASHVERFEREALALSRLSHQSTVRLFDFGSDERGCPFIVMEYLEGTDVAADLERHGPMRWDQALAIASQILGSLAEAHAVGIIHRDIKPANLFLCAAGEWPVVKVLDFGIAGGAEPHVGLRKLTLTGTVLGSAPYMSPEQAQGLPVSPAADLYSLGVVLFEMLTGRTPFGPRTLTAQLIAKVLEVAPRLRDVCPDVEAPLEVQELVASLLERDPGRRPPSARATADRIAALLARSALPPLSRAAQRPKASSQPISKTEPMLLPRTIDEGWSPPKTEAPAPPRPRAAVGLGLLLAAASAAAAAGLWRALPEPAEASEPRSTLAALGVSAASNQEPKLREEAPAALDGGVVSSGVGADAASPAEPGPSSPQPLAVALVPPPLAVVRQRLETRTPNTAARASRTPNSRSAALRTPKRSTREATAAAAPSAPPEPATPLTPETLVLPRAVPPPDGPAPEPADAESPAASGAPSPEVAPPEGMMPGAPTQEMAAPEAAPSIQERSEPALGAPIVDPRYWTIAAARAAARRGDITPAQRNEIIVGLRQRRLSARARAARAYREGRISFEALLHRQRTIDRRIDGW